jgi:hypothetical protein
MKEVKIKRSNTITYFVAPSLWDQGKAKAHAESWGLDTRFNGTGSLLIEKKFVRDRFYIDNPIGKNGELSYEGFKMLMNVWNGFEIPYFWKGVAEQVVADYMKSYDPEEDGVRLEWDGANLLQVYEEGGMDIITPTIIHVDGVETIAYEMSLGWTWNSGE